MHLQLKRKWFTRLSTIGELYVNGILECLVLEDTFRPPSEKKIPRLTAIPNGTYQVTMKVVSPRFGKVLPRLVGVPNFEGVLIHPGNVPDDTEGCLLPGRVRLVDKVLESKLAFEALEKKMQAADAAAEPITIEVSGTP